jgi:predicted dehydrogenase
MNGLEQATLWTEGDDGPRAELLDSPYPGIHKGVLVDSFISAAAGGPPPIVTAAEVFEVLATCFAIDRAAESGQPVEVRPFD